MSTSEYDYIEANGQVIDIYDGQTWENKLIDLGNGNDIDIVTHGSNWTIRNIGVQGTWHHTTHDYIFSLRDENGGTSTFEHVFIGYGDPNAASDERGGCVWVPGGHSGEIHFNNCNFHIGGALGVYGHVPGVDGAGGTLHFTDCYAEDCNHTCYRFADNGCTLDNCVLNFTGEFSVNRGCWIWEGYGGGSDLTDCDFTTNGYGAASIVERNNPEYTMTNVATDDGHGTTTDPQVYVPDGTPTSADEAASGGTSDASGPVLYVDGSVSPSSTNYSFRTTEEPVFSDYGEASVDSDQWKEEQPDGSWIAGGWVGEWYDAFELPSGADLTHLGADDAGAAQFMWHGAVVDPANYPHPDSWSYDDGGDDTGGAAGVDAYRVYLDGVHEQTVDTEESLHVSIGGLSPETSYDLEVTAVYDDVESEPASTTFTTPAPSAFEMAATAPSQILEGESAEVVVELTNTGEESIDVDLELFFDVDESSRPTEPSVDVDTLAPDDQGDSIRIRGDLLSLTEVSEADCGFYYRPVGANDWQASPTGTFGEPTTYYHELLYDALDADTQYEYFAVAFDTDSGDQLGSGSTTTFTTPADDDETTTAETFAIDYDAHYDEALTDGGLSSAYDRVADTRSTGQAYLNQWDDGNVVNVQATMSGGCPAKSSNCLVQFDDRIGYLPQEVYFEYDVLFSGDSFVLANTDTYRFFWNMNRYDGNQYDSTNGYGFSNAIGVTPRGDPSPGSYNFFSYTYDARGASNFWRTDFEIPTGEWFTLKGYCKCNDIGQSNAVQKYWYNDQLMQRMDGFRTSANENGWNHEFGPTGYYTYCNATGSDRIVFFDNPRYWVDSDIPSDIRE